MKKSLVSLSMFVFVGLLCGQLFADLKIGDTAPEIKVAEWVKNGPVKLSDGLGKNVYIVEFWATWCGPCRVSIPHLSKLQKEFKDKGLIVVGISDEEPAVVKKFVADQKDMDYNVGIDNKRETNDLYMKGIGGIPTAFIIGKDGKIAWIGHPMEMDDILSRIIDGKYDAKAEGKLSEAKDALEKALRSNDLEKALKAADDLLKLDPVNMMAVNVKLIIMVQSGKVDDAIKFMDQTVKANPKNKNLYFLKLNVLGKLDKNELYEACCKEYITNFADSAENLNELAWMLMGKPVGDANLNICLEAAQAARKALGKDAEPEQKSAVLDTLAKCYYLLGRIDKAIETERESYEVLQDKGSDTAKDVIKMVKYYENAEALGKTLK